MPRNYKNVRNPKNCYNSSDGIYKRANSMTTGSTDQHEKLNEIEETMDKRAADIALTVSDMFKFMSISAAMLPNMELEVECMRLKVDDDGVFFSGINLFFAGIGEILSAMEPEKKKSAPKKKAADKSTELTVDDLIKVVTQKIKQDRANKEKVLGFLKTYGAAKISDVPVDKYEAFLTDLSQI